MYNIGYDIRLIIHLFLRLIIHLLYYYMYIYLFISLDHRVVAIWGRSAADIAQREAQGPELMACRAAVVLDS
jgi:hypothetical protein